MASQYIRYPADQNSGGTITNINTTAVGPSVSIVAGSGINVGTVGNTITITNTAGTPSGTPETFAGFNALGALSTIPAWSFDSTTGEGIVFITGAQPTTIELLNLNSSAAVTGSLAGLDVNLNGASSTAGSNAINISLGNMTSSAGDIHAINIDVGTAVDNNPQGVIGISSNGRLQNTSQSDLIAGQVFQVGSRLAHLMHVPSGSPVTNTDSLGVNIAGDIWAEDNIADGVTAGLVGATGVGFVASLAVNATKTVDTLNVFLAASATPDPGVPTGGTVTNMSLIRTAPPLAQGGTLAVTNLYGLKIDSGLSSLATNSWGIYIADTTSNNHFGGPVDMKTLQLNGSTSGILSINASAVTTSHTLTMPAAQGAASTVLTNNGSGVLSWAAAIVTPVSIANGGTGQTTKAAAFDALSPMTTGGDIIYGGAAGTGTRLPNGTAGQVLQSNGTTTAPSWVTPASAGANTALSNLTSTSINQNLLPDTDTGRNIGTAASRWGTITAQVLQTSDGSSGMQIFPAGATSPSGASAPLMFGYAVSGAATNTAVITSTNATANATATANVLIESGNKTAGTGNSGNINIQTGTSAGGTRGSISLNGSSINANSTQIHNVTDPSSAQDAATKAYVDAQVSPVTTNTDVWTITSAGTVTSQSVWLTHVGDLLIVRGYFTSGTPAGAAFSIDFPSGITINTAKLPSSHQKLGSLDRITSGGGGFSSTGQGPYSIFYDGTTNNKVFCATTCASQTAYTKSNGSSIFAANDSGSFEFIVPVN